MKEVRKGEIRAKRAIVKSKNPQKIKSLKVHKSNTKLVSLKIQQKNKKVKIKVLSADRKRKLKKSHFIKKREVKKCVTCVSRPAPSLPADHVSSVSGTAQSLD